MVDIFVVQTRREKLWEEEKEEDQIDKSGFQTIIQHLSRV